MSGLCIYMYIQRTMYIFVHFLYTIHVGSYTYYCGDLLNVMSCSVVNVTCHTHVNTVNQLHDIHLEPLDLSVTPVAIKMMHLSYTYIHVQCTYN